MHAIQYRSHVHLAPKKHGRIFVREVHEARIRRAEFLDIPSQGRFDWFRFLCRFRLLVFIQMLCDRSEYERAEFVWRGELAGQLLGQQMLTQCLDALTSIISRVRIIEYASPRRRVLNDKRQAVLLAGFGAAIFQLSDGKAIWIIVLCRWDIPVPKREEPT